MPPTSASSLQGEAVGRCRTREGARPEPVHPRPKAWLHSAAATQHRWNPRFSTAGLGLERRAQISGVVAASPLRRRGHFQGSLPAGPLPRRARPGTRPRAPGAGRGGGGRGRTPRPVGGGSGGLQRGRAPTPLPLPSPPLQIFPPRVSPGLGPGFGRESFRPPPPPPLFSPPPGRGGRRLAGEEGIPRPGLAGRAQSVTWETEPPTPAAGLEPGTDLARLPLATEGPGPGRGRPALPPPPAPPLPPLPPPPPSINNFFTPCRKAPFSCLLSKPSLSPRPGDGIPGLFPSV